MIRPTNGEIREAPASAQAPAYKQSPNSSTDEQAIISAMFHRASKRYQKSTIRNSGHRYCMPYIPVSDEERSSIFPILSTQQQTCTAYKILATICLSLTALDCIHHWTTLNWGLEIDFPDWKVITSLKCTADSRLRLRCESQFTLQIRFCITGALTWAKLNSKVMLVSMPCFCKISQALMPSQVDAICTDNCIYLRLLLPCNTQQVWDTCHLSDIFCGHGLSPLIAVEPMLTQVSSLKSLLHQCWPCRPVSASIVYKHCQ